jgi:hypothetical protein
LEGPRVDATFQGEGEREESEEEENIKRLAIASKYEKLYEPERVFPLETTGSLARYSPLPESAIPILA